MYIYSNFRLFPKDSDEVIDYIGERKVDKMSKFLKSHGKQANTPPKVI